MNIQQIDQLFLRRYPNGVNDDAFVSIGRKHQSSDRILATFQEQLTINRLISTNRAIQEETIKAIIKVVSQSTLLSTFDKIAFKNYMKDQKIYGLFLHALAEMLNDFNEETLDAFVKVCSLKKQESNANIAKWPIVSFFLTYHDPYEHIFIKPTTIKQLSKVLDYDIQYHALPNYQTYKLAREMVFDFKNQSSLTKGLNNIMVQAILYSSI